LVGFQLETPWKDEKKEEAQIKWPNSAKKNITLGGGTVAAKGEAPPPSALKNTPNEPRGKKKKHLC